MTSLTLVIFSSWPILTRRQEGIFFECNPNWSWQWTPIHPSLIRRVWGVPLSLPLWTLPFFLLLPLILFL